MQLGDLVRPSRALRLSRTLPEGRYHEMRPVLCYVGSIPSADVFVAPDMALLRLDRFVPYDVVSRYEDAEG